MPDMENISQDEEKQPDQLSETERLVELGHALLEKLPVLAPLWSKAQSDKTDAIREHNQVQARLWSRALILESVFIGAVLIGGFGASVALAYGGHIESAEKIAFALFGFIGGRGFLHIRGLIDTSSKRS